MNAFGCICKIVETKLVESDLRYCLIDSRKLPYQISGLPARSNDDSTFVDFDTLLTCDKLNEYEGVGISVQASKICAVDIDHCLSVKDDFSSMSDLAKEIVDMFKDFAYIESSFSGFGIRILMKQRCVPDYKTNYYLKNSKIKVEYYQFDQPGRYVSVTGNCYVNNSLDAEDKQDVIVRFLEKYMKRQYQFHVNVVNSQKDERSIDELMKKVKHLYRTDSSFQDLWFEKAPGHGSNESERDYRLVAEIYENVTKDEDKILQIFKQSKFYKSKDSEHIYKFTRDDHKYFKYLYSVINGKN